MLSQGNLEGKSKGLEQAKELLEKSVKTTGNLQVAYKSACNETT